jgi:hypothetical protein
MTRLLTLFFCVLGVCACATVDDPNVSLASTTPIAKESAPTQSVNKSHPVDNANDDIDEPEKDAISVPVAAVATELESIEPPPISQSEVPIAASPKTERVCRREKRTGSNMAVRVCRTRAEMERLEEESKDTFRALHQSQMLEQ